MGMSSPNLSYHLFPTRSQLQVAVEIVAAVAAIAALAQALALAAA